jgi:hypothetical protein
MLAAAGHHDLVGLTLTDHDHSVIEQALHSIDSAFEHHPELLDYALNILACTNDPAAKPMIDPCGASTADTASTRRSVQARLDDNPRPKRLSVGS